jgi:O-antigen/teichoic acid export membrane protein
MLAMAGLNEAGLRFVSHCLGLAKPQLARQYLRQCAGWMTVTSAIAVLVISGCLTAWQLATGRLDRPVLYGVLIATTLLALAWQQWAAEMLRGWHELRLASLFSGGQTGGPLSNGLFIAALAASVMLIPSLDATWVLGFLAGSVVVTAPLALLGLARTAGRPGSDGLPEARLAGDHSRELAAVAGTLLAIQLLTFVTQQIDVWIGGALLSDEHLGLYGVAKRSLLLAAMPVQMAMLAVVGRVPHLHAQNRLADLQRLWRGAALAAAAPALAALGGLMLFPETVLRLVFGPSYAGAAALIVVLGLGHLVLVLSGNPVHVLVMTGRHRVALMVNVLAALILVCGGWLATRQFGSLGLAAASASSLAVQNGLLWWLARRHAGIWTHVGWPQGLTNRLSLSGRVDGTRITMESVSALPPAGGETDLAASQP